MSRAVDATLRQQSLVGGLEEAEFQVARAGVIDENVHKYLV
jgi:hypothetical protein